MTATYWLLADVGGTNIRLALMPSEDRLFADKLLEQQQALASERRYLWSSYPTLQNAIEVLFADLGVNASAVVGAVIAVAGPVVAGKDHFEFTNVDRGFRRSELKSFLKTDRVYIINDYQAQGMVIPLVRTMPNRLTTIYDAPGNPMGAIGVLGPGTGLGVAAVYPPGSNPMVKAEATLVVPGEGGHVALGARVRTVQELLPFMQASLEAFRFNSTDSDKSATLRYEDVLSGFGLQCVHGALCLRNGRAPIWPSPDALSSSALDDHDPLALETFAVFFDVLAQACSDVALQYLSNGGVYITGGIVPKNLGLLDRQRFADIFQDSWRSQKFLAQIPIHVVTSSSSGLSGAAVFAASIVTSR